MKELHALQKNKHTCPLLKIRAKSKFGSRDALHLALSVISPADRLAVISAIELISVI